MTPRRLGDALGAASVFWLWLAVAIVLALTSLVLLGAYYGHLQVRRNYLAKLVRIFQEKPYFIIPRGQPVDDAEEVRFQTVDGLTLVGCYLKTPVSPRRGVILFGLEFGSNRWSCVPYCDFLRNQGFDIFTFEPRNQGDSESLPGYEPLQWVTDFEVKDMQGAIAYLKQRPDADPRGIGFFGISKGAGAGLLAASREPYVLCFVTDGVFATHTTMVPYMRKWITIYSNRVLVQKWLPQWYYGYFARMGLKEIQRERGCRFPHLERALPRLAPRPLLMIHGAEDNYIKPEMGQALFDRAFQPKSFWLVPGAKHNQSLSLAGDEYRRRVLDFFLHSLVPETTPVPQIATQCVSPSYPANGQRMNAASSSPLAQSS